MRPVTTTNCYQNNSTELLLFAYRDAFYFLSRKTCKEHSYEGTYLWGTKKPFILLIVVAAYLHVSDAPIIG